MNSFHISQNVSSGHYAVALTGYRGWHRDSAIGDGITSATAALVTRCDSKAEAEAVAEEMNAQHAEPRPGSQDVPVYDARPYVRDDYMSRQAKQNNRSCDRRIVRI